MSPSLTKNSLYKRKLPLCFKSSTAVILTSHHLLKYYFQSNLSSLSRPIHAGFDLQLSACDRKQTFIVLMLLRPGKRVELVVPVSIIVFSPSFLSSQMEIKYRIILSVSANSTDPHKKKLSTRRVSAMPLLVSAFLRRGWNG